MNLELIFISEPGMPIFKNMENGLPVIEAKNGTEVSLFDAFSGLHTNRYSIKSDPRVNQGWD